jgi:hypothetical protein
MRLRRAAEAAETAATLNEEAEETVRAVAEEIEEEERGACYDNSDNKHNKRNRQESSSPPRPHPSFQKPKTSMNQSTRARESAQARPRARPSPSAWMNPYNLEGRDPVDLALEAIGRTRFRSKADEARERACWGAHLKRLGPRRFCEALHVFEVDGQYTAFKNRAAALNAHLAAVPAETEGGGDLSTGGGAGHPTPRVGSCGPGPEGMLRTAGSRGTRD